MDVELINPNHLKIFVSFNFCSLLFLAKLIFFYADEQ